jgi:hypothetical protein
MYADDDEYHNKYINQSEFQQSYENVGGENDEMTPQFAMKSNKIGGKKVKIMKNTNIYPIQTILSSDDSISLSGITKVSLCIYRINIKPSSTPFLEYLLFKNRSNTMVFPGFDGGKQTNILGSANKLYDSIIGKNDLAMDHYKGLLRVDDVLHVFYQYINDNVIENPYKSKDVELWWCLMDEICNWRKVLTMHVDSRVVGLFYQKPELIYLYDTNYNKLEVPIVGYYGTYYKLLEFIYTFGVKENDVASMYGPYYYFSTFNRAVKYAGWYYEGNKELIKEHIVVDEHGRFDKGGVLRAALFMNNMKVFLNHPMDPVDNSEISAAALKDIDRRENMKAKLRLVDYDATWVNEYESVYAGRALRDNGQPLFDYPEMVVKNNSQQVVLSIHVIDKKTLGEKWNPNEESYDFL